MNSALETLSRLLIGWRFPAFVLFVLLFADALTVAILLIPSSNTALGAFAEEFKIWCFGYDPSTGTLEWSYVWMLLIELLVLAGVVLVVWWRPLRQVFPRPRKLVSPAVAALSLVAASAVAFGTIRPSRTDNGEIPFPAERIRTAFPAPDFSLINQDGSVVSLSRLRGRVVMITGVYSTCGYTCPTLMREARQAIMALTPQEQKDLTVVAITLDPERDTPRELARMAQFHRVSAPLFNLVTGDPATVHRTLDALSISRVRNTKTGVIDHANVFILVDRGGRIAYRLALGPRQRQWLPSALRVLLRE